MTILVPEEATSPLSDSWGEEGVEVLSLEDARFLTTEMELWSEIAILEVHRAF